MAKYEILLTATEEKILLSQMVSIQDWFENAIQERLRHAAISCIEVYTERNHKKMTKAEMVSVLASVDIPPISAVDPTSPRGNR